MRISGVGRFPRKGAKGRGRRGGTFRSICRGGRPSLANPGPPLVTPAPKLSPREARSASRRKRALPNLVTCLAPLGPLPGLIECHVIPARLAPQRWVAGIPCGDEVPPHPYDRRSRESENPTLSLLTWPPPFEEVRGAFRGGDECHELHPRLTDYTTRLPLQANDSQIPEIDSALCLACRGGPLKIAPRPHF